ncbi:SPFH domain-containing protein [Lipingzhangella sp. LS1_29]|uniref:SPFH domain-containing protein n=1 Tax=Lipingzhangella rawalii TaxID=2055835 RepID=A0ABU2H7I3_9ACTN|nr:SPFH domain-containing protein [Lipingzhangella rawalii]MDS1271267.1 SPFH domain-containing protein [Lipingzhangella rawalii]
MSFAQSVRGAAESVVQGQDPREAVSEALGQASEGIGLDPNDFLAAREQGASVGTRIEQKTSSLNNADEAINHSKREMTREGPVHVISPLVVPRNRTLGALIPVALVAIVGIIGSVITASIDVSARAVGMDSALWLTYFGPLFWLLVILLAVFMWWRQGLVMVPDGCQALVTRFGKLEQIADPGQLTLWNPFKRVSYIVNIAREYPYNAPIREAPTKSGVKASVDLFVQFRIEDPEQFIFVLGGVHGFQEKLDNAISETTRSLIYDQEAAEIYDLVGENTVGLLDQLNQQFLPAVRLTNANITHAEPSSQEYRMNLAAPEMVRVGKEAYTYEYELQMRKEQNEGDLNRELASLNETLSSIQADIAQYQAQMDTALERENNRARAVARQRFVEAESSAHANAALLEAQALDIRSVSAAEAPEILNYRYRQEMLEKLESVADSLPQVVQVGDDGNSINFLEIAKQIVGTTDNALFSEEDMAAIHGRLSTIQERIASREEEINELLRADEESEEPEVAADQDTSGDVVEEIRRSVSDDAIEERLDSLTEQQGADDAGAHATSPQPPSAESGGHSWHGPAPGGPSGPVQGGE